MIFFFFFYFVINVEKESVKFSGQYRIKNSMISLDMERAVNCYTASDRQFSTRSPLFWYSRGERAILASVNEDTTSMTMLDMRPGISCPIWDGENRW